jgi:hypothetical protein
MKIKGKEKIKDVCKYKWKIQAELGTNRYSNIQ